MFFNDGGEVGIVLNDIMPSSGQLPPQINPAFLLRCNLPYRLAESGVLSDRIELAGVAGLSFVSLRVRLQNSVFPMLLVPDDDDGIPGD